MPSSKANNSHDTNAKAHLRIMATTDVHMHLRPFDYFSDRPAQLTSLAGLEPVLDAARKEVENSFLVDNGDFLQGTPMSDMIAEPDNGWPADAPHPAIAAMNALGYDAGTLGNHEFNFGLGYLARALAHAKHPIVLSNVELPAEFDDAVQPTQILTRCIKTTQGDDAVIRIGILGLTPPQIMEWDAYHLRGKVRAMPIIDCAARQVAKLRAAGADVVLALCHSGIGHDQSLARGEDVGLELARRVKGIDALILGHSHLLFPQANTPRHSTDIDDQNGKLAGVACVMAGANAGHLGVIDLTISQSETGWDVTSATAHLRQAHPKCREAGQSGGPALLRATEAGHKKTLAYIRQPVGSYEMPLNTFFAALGHDPATRLVAGAKLQVARAALAGTQHESLPLLAAVAPFKVGGRGGPTNFTDIAGGQLTMRNVADLYHYPNTITALVVDGAAVHDWLERAAGLFAQITPGPSPEPQALLDPEFPVYNFDTIFGVTYQIDPSQPSRFDTETGALQAPDAHRIRDLRWNGKPVQKDQKYIVATNNYRAGGGGSFCAVAGAPSAMASSQTTRGAILAYLQSSPANNKPGPTPWTFAPCSGATVWFDTSPKARNHVPENLAARLHDLGDRPNGYARFQFSL